MLVDYWITEPVPHHTATKSAACGAVFFLDDRNITPDKGIPNALASQNSDLNKRVI